MKVAKINPEKCDRSPACPAARICPQNAIKPTRGEEQRLPNFFGPYQVNEEICTGCGNCVKICPTNSIELVENLDKKDGVNYNTPYGIEGRDKSASL